MAWTSFPIERKDKVYSALSFLSSLKKFRNVYYLNCLLKVRRLDYPFNIYTKSIYYTESIFRVQKYNSCMFVASEICMQGRYYILLVSYARGL